MMRLRLLNMGDSQMIEVKIDCWKLQNLFNEKRELYEKLYSISKESFLSLPDKYEAGPDGKITKSNYTDMKFYINDLGNINMDILKYCELAPVGMLEMMGGAKINTENVVEAMKRNQIMLPNNLIDRKSVV